MNRTERIVGLVVTVSLAAFVWVQNYHNRRTDRSISANKAGVALLDRDVRRIGGDLVFCYDLMLTNNANFARSINVIFDAQRKHLDDADAFMATNRADVAAMRKVLASIARDTEADRATVKVLAQLFAERLKDHATLFAMTGKLSESVASLTNLIRVVEAQEVRK